MKKTKHIPTKYWSKALEGVTTEVGLLAAVKRQQQRVTAGVPNRVLIASSHWELLH